MLLLMRAGPGQWIARSRCGSTALAAQSQRGTMVPAEGWEILRRAELAALEKCRKGSGRHCEVKESVCSRGRPD